jgi:hypothetical protein
MSGHREYDIPFVGLKPGIHHYEYEITDKFFADYNEQDFSNCHATVKLTLEKNAGFMILKFDVGERLKLFATGAETCFHCNFGMNSKWL